MLRIPQQKRHGELNMDNKFKIAVSGVISKYNNQTLEYGKFDCNLMILEAFEHDKYEIICGRYKTVVGGARVAKKEFGYSRLDDYISQSPDYKLIEKPFIMSGDIIFSHIDNIAMIALGCNKAFAVLPNTNEFSRCDVDIPEAYNIYRRI